MSQTLTAYLEENAAPSALKSVIATLAQACSEIAAQVRLGALAGVLGSAGSGNIQGEEQKKLDVLANDLLIRHLHSHPAVAGLASEEEDDFVAAQDSGAYLVLFDPLDGSSNIDVNISVGTIFSVLPRPEGTLNAASFLQAGHCQAAAGYVLYGPQTLLVFSFGEGVVMFTLNQDNTFVLTQSAFRLPEHCAEFAINMSNQRHWEAPMQTYIAELLQGKTGPRGKDYNMRWVASMVAEVHRILVRGGVFTYPKDARDPAKPGKLRLMYEANPMSFLIQAAGGTATNALMPILEIQPQHLHERVAVVLGCREEVDYITTLHRQA